MLDAYAHAILDFVMARCHKSGGFGAAPTLPPSIEDTYHALSVLKLILPFSKEIIHAIQENSSLSHYLQEVKDKETWRVQTVYHYLCSCHFAGVNKGEDLSWLKRYLISWLKSTRELSDWYYATRSLREYLGKSILGEGKNLLKKPHGKWRTARELWMLLYIANGSPERLSTTKKKLVTWVQACQNPDGGFGYLPGTTSFIENALFCMSILSLLGAKPLKRHKAREFIMRCKTARGGFSRRSGAAPFLDTTWHAVKTLALLEKPTNHRPALQKSQQQTSPSTRKKKGF